MMKVTDKNLGMDRPITRRDLLNGIGALTAGTLLSSCNIPVQQNSTARKTLLPDAYPPARTGMRGNHPGSFDTAHQLARAGRKDWGPIQQVDDEYDLVIVGAGISGLASAHYYLAQEPDARILILDNHDDFGGHAKRNEFQLGDHSLIGYGGSQTLESPGGYSQLVKDLLSELGFKLDRFHSAYDSDFYRRHNLAEAIYFGKESWGVERTIRYGLGTISNYVPLVPSSYTSEEAVRQMPLSGAAQEQLLKLLNAESDHLAHIPADKKEDYLWSISYRDFLRRHMNITEEEVFKFLQDLATDTGVGIESATALFALGYVGMPGWKATGQPKPVDEPYIHHFPDGNASIARLLVRRLMPRVAAGNSMEDIVQAKFDYSRLDDADAPVRLRLNSTVVRVEHESRAGASNRVQLAYERNGVAYGIKARQCVLACNNSIIPHLCPELPASQGEALAQQVKSAMFYTNVALTNWRAWDKMGIGAALCPGSYHVLVKLDFPVSLGDYQFSDNPDQPIIVHMERFLHRPNEGLSKRDQHKLARHELMTTSFESIERHIRKQLTGMLSEGGFDPARDIAAITVNRWSHAYAYSYSPLFDETYDDRNDARYPHVRGRATFGRIAIANADAGARALLPTAIEQAHRAIEDLS